MTIRVVLDVDKKDPHFSALRSLGEQVSMGERTVLRLSCKEVDFSGSILRLVLNHPQNRKGLTIWVHSELMIFAYCGPGGKVGF
jgi:hypothetical protein